VYSLLHANTEERPSVPHLPPVGAEEGEEVSIGNKLSDETERLLQCDTPIMLTMCGL